MADAAIVASRPHRSRLISSLVGLYALGLILWLLLGLLPTLASDIGPVRHWIESVAASSGPLATPARRILDANQSMPGMVMAASNTNSVLLAYLFSLLNLSLGLILAFRRSAQLVPTLMAFALLGTAATFNKPSHAVFHIIGEPWPVKTIHFTFHIVSGVTYLWAVILFPDGRLPRSLNLHGRPLAAAVAAVTVLISIVSWRSSFVDHPLFFVVFFGVVVSIIGLLTQVLRFTDIEAPSAERRSARLLAAALVPAFATGVAWLIGRTLVEVSGSPAAARFDVSLQGVFPAVFAIVPVVLFAGILRYRLWNIDWLLSRSLVYATLAVLVAAAYVAAVSISGLMAGRNIASIVVVLSVVAVGIDPLRRKLRSWCNRLVYGQVLSPTEAVQVMLAGLERLAPAGELSQLVRVVVDSTRARRCELWLVSGDHELRVASHPDPSGSESRRPLNVARQGSGPSVPVSYQGQVLGWLTTEMPDGMAMGASDLTLIEDLASHAGVIAHNASLNSDLAHYVSLLATQLEELRQSRRRLVAAQDAERRRLERDLHDGAQQALVAAMIGIRLAAGMGDRPEDQETEVEDLVGLLQETVVGLDDLVGGDGPQVLAEQGLIRALGEVARLAVRTGQEVEILGRVSPDLPTDVATTVYFCCLEALQNAIKHAGASKVAIVLADDDFEVSFSIRDDGSGFDPEQHKAGTGLANLASRVSVLGGTVEVETAPGVGTVVRGRLPLYVVANRS